MYIIFTTQTKKKIGGAREVQSLRTLVIDHERSRCTRGAPIFFFVSLRTFVMAHERSHCTRGPQFSLV